MIANHYYGKTRNTRVGFFQACDALPAVLPDGRGISMPFAIFAGMWIRTIDAASASSAARTHLR